MKKRGKKAQFYLIAAIVIAMLIISFAGIKNYTRAREKPIKFYDLSEELDKEGVRVVDYGIYNEEDIPLLIDGFIEGYFLNYTDEKERNAELVFIYGDKTDAKVSTYKKKSTGAITISSQGNELTGTQADREWDREVKEIDLVGIGGEAITIEISEKEYKFNLKEGENFLFMMKKESRDGSYVVTREETEN